MRLYARAPAVGLQEMLKDKVRTLTYRAAIEGNPHLFKDKVKPNPLTLRASLKSIASARHLSYAACLPPLVPARPCPRSLGKRVVARSS